jgi:hypothetical protein
MSYKYSLLYIYQKSQGKGIQNRTVLPEAGKSVAECAEISPRGEVQRTHYPTQAKTGLEWATRVEWATADTDYAQRLPTPTTKQSRHS